MVPRYPKSHVSHFFFLGHSTLVALLESAKSLVSVGLGCEKARLFKHKQSSNVSKGTQDFPLGICTSIVAAMVS